MKRTTSMLLAGVLVLGLSGIAQATLYDRGGGMIYDSDQDLTWLQDANYAKTSGYDADGLMGWDDAVAWAAGLSYGGYNDWRLPNIAISNDTWAYSGTDRGYNVNTANSELAYLWYEILGNIPYFDTSGSGPQVDWGLTSTGADAVNFNNLHQPNDYYSYWSGAYYYAPDSGFAWAFFTGLGAQNFDLKDNESYAWAVRSGDVAVVPVPAALWLFGTGLMGLLGMGRWRRR